jgi:DNA mismatch endonuclease, patch repair protein
MDTLSARERSDRMSRIRHKNTNPELLVRRIVYSMGYRYRLHEKQLPGRPDIVFGPRRKVILVHGCFWHRHPDPKCRLARWPKSRLSFWKPKLRGNRRRDLRTEGALRREGWKVLVIWECQLTNRIALIRRITHFLGPVG